MIDIQFLKINAEILKDKRLTYFEKLLLALIEYRSNGEPCKDTNQDIADVFGTQWTTVTDSIKKLKQKGFLKVGFEGKRTLEVLAVGDHRYGYEISNPSENSKGYEKPKPPYEKPNPPIRKNLTPTIYKEIIKESKKNIYSGENENSALLEVIPVVSKMAITENQALEVTVVPTEKVGGTVATGRGRAARRPKDEIRFDESEIWDFDNFRNYIEHSYVSASPEYYYDTMRTWALPVGNEPKLRKDWKMTLRTFVVGDIQKNKQVTREHYNQMTNNVSGTKSPTKSDLSTVAEKYFSSRFGKG